MWFSNAILENQVTEYFISCALYGLLLFYGLTKEELAGRRPLAKFLCIKFIVILTFYQSFLVCPMLRFPVGPWLCLHVSILQFTALEGKVIKGMSTHFLLAR
jgi:hypothetical protein